MVLAVLMSSRGMGGVDESESCRTWKMQLFGRRKTGVHQRRSRDCEQSGWCGLESTRHTVNSTRVDSCKKSKMQRKNKKRRALHK